MLILLNANSMYWFMHVQLIMVVCVPNVKKVCKFPIQRIFISSHFALCHKVTTIYIFGFQILNCAYERVVKGIE